MSGERALLLDTNLLLLLVVGSARTAWIGAHGRTAGYTRDDYELVSLYVEDFRGNVITTPHVLAETCNHVDTGGFFGPWREELMEHFAWYASQLRELHVPCVGVTGDPVFLRLGLTDTALVHLAQREQFTLMTADRRLADHASALGLPLIDF